MPIYRFITQNVHGTLSFVDACKDIWSCQRTAISSFDTASTFPQFNQY